MSIGDLRRRATIQGESLTPDGGGGHALAWVDVATVWAEIEPRAGTERLAAGRLEATLRVRARLRHRDGLHAGMRLLVDGRALNIRAVLADPERRWLVLDCEEGVAT